MRIGLDIGGTKIDAVAVDDALASRAPVHRVRLASGYGADEVVGNAVEAVRHLAALTGVPPQALDSIGVGVPGVVDPATGRVAHAVNLGLVDVPLGDELARRVGAPVRVENDVNAAALGAWHALGLQGSAAYLNLGTGLAAGLVLDGRLRRGAHGAAGEIGHVPVDPAGAWCACGQRGCLETVASGSAAARLWPTTALHPARALLDAAATGDHAALRARAVLVDGVAQAVRLLALTVDVQTVVVGGGLSALGDDLMGPVRDALADQGAASSFIASLELASRLVLLPAGLPAAAMGAALAGTPADPVPVAAAG
ncbi:ROK family protein [Frigoribacterium faeni]|uniref:ROK family protein n=1 Tax=Frigoribacterium faeni TaxID=145483 RepID=UPI00326454BC|nr:putative NBD/HSP70 family sugar kinase [Frigoribacterium faeni]